MAIEDYAKTKADSAKTRTENAKTRKDLTKRMEACIKKAKGFADTFTDNQKIFDEFESRADTGYAAWVKIADQIIPLQTDLKAAKKAKDKAKIKDLEKQIAKLDGQATKEADKVSKAVKDSNQWKTIAQDWMSSMEEFRL